MSFTLKVLTAALGSLTTLTSAYVHKLKKGENIVTMSNTFDYNVYSLYNSTIEETVEMDSKLPEIADWIEDRTKGIADKSDKKYGVWEPRNIGYWSIDLNEHPEVKQLARGKDSATVVQAVGMEKWGIVEAAHLDFKIKKNKGARYMDQIRDWAIQIKDLTGDWVKDVACDRILADDRRYKYETVYFGNKNQLEEGGKAAFYKIAAMQEAYWLGRVDGHAGIGFYVNDDPECRVKLDMKKSKHYFITFQAGKEDHAHTILKKGMTLDKFLVPQYKTVFMNNPSWSRRAWAMMNELGQNALIFVMPSDYQDQVLTEWRLHLLEQTNILLERNNADFISLMYVVNDSESTYEEPNLKDLMKLKPDEVELPAFFIWNGKVKSFARHNTPTDNIENYNPDVMALWAVLQQTQMQIDSYEQHLHEAEEKNMINSEEDHLQASNMRTMIADLELKVTNLGEEWTKAKAALIEKNEFADEWKAILEGRQDQVKEQKEQEQNKILREMEAKLNAESQAKLDKEAAEAPKAIAGDPEEVQIEL